MVIYSYYLLIFLLHFDHLHLTIGLGSWQNSRDPIHQIQTKAPHLSIVCEGEKKHVKCHIRVIYQSQSHFLTLHRKFRKQVSNVLFTFHICKILREVETNFVDELAGLINKFKNSIIYQSRQVTSMAQHIKERIMDLWGPTTYS